MCQYFPKLGSDDWAAGLKKMTKKELIIYIKILAEIINKKERGEK